jgi:hypothetical protein
MGERGATAADRLDKRGASKQVPTRCNAGNFAGTSAVSNRPKSNLQEPLANKGQHHRPTIDRATNADGHAHANCDRAKCLAHADGLMPMASTVTGIGRAHAIDERDRHDRDHHDGSTRIVVEAQSEEDAQYLCREMGWELICAWEG